MNQANFKKLIDKYIEKLVVTNDENHDEVFKWIACLQFKKLDLETEDFIQASKALRSQMDMVKQEIDELNTEVAPSDNEETLAEIEKVMREMLEEQSNSGLLDNLVEAIIHQEEDKYVWLLNFHFDKGVSDITDENRMEFVRKHYFTKRNIVKDKSTLLATFTITEKDAKAFKKKNKLGHLKR